MSRDQSTYKYSFCPSCLNRFHPIFKGQALTGNMNSTKGSLVEDGIDTVTQVFHGDNGELVVVAHIGGNNSIVHGAILLQILDVKGNVHKSRFVPGKERVGLSFGIKVWDIVRRSWKLGRAFVLGQTIKEGTRVI